MIRNVFRYHSIGSDEGVSSQCYAANDGGVGADGCPFFYKCWARLIHFSDFGPGIIDVCKDHGWAAENSVFECNAFVYAYIILNFAVVAYSDIRADYHVLADIAVFANFGVGQDVGEVPDFRFFANGYVFIYLGGRMDKRIGIKD